MGRVRSLAWQFAHANSLLGFSKHKTKAGRTWAKHFLKRYPMIRIKKSVNLSIARAMAANEANIRKWFTEYEAVLQRLGITSPMQIWSGDETGVQSIPKEHKVLGLAGTTAYTTVGAEKGETSTILSFVNGIGDVCPPMVLHKGQRVQEAWLQNKPPQVSVSATSKGYITKNKFYEYGVRFVKYLGLKGYLGRPHLLIMDSHKSHVYNLQFYEELHANNIYVLALPPHTSHIIQALDNLPFAQFKINWQKMLRAYNLRHKGAPLSKRDFFIVFWPAWKHAMTVRFIQGGFRRTGIYPVNFDAIDKSKMTPSILTDMSKGFHLELQIAVRFHVFVNFSLGLVVVCPIVAYFSLDLDFSDFSLGPVVGCLNVVYISLQMQMQLQLLRRHRSLLQDNKH